MVFQIEEYIPNQFLRAIAILFAVFIILKFVIFIIEKVIFRFTRKTKTQIDDLFIEKISKPITFLILLIGLYFAIRELALSEEIASVVFKIIFSFVIIFVGYLVYVVVDIILINSFKKVVNKTKTGIDDSLISLINSILKVIWIVFAFLYILDLWGVHVGPFLAGLGIAGIAIALALQPTLSNIFSGVSMILDKSIRVGDLVYLDAETKGKIAKIGLRSTKIKTFDNELIIVPNNKLADSKIQNVALPEPKSRVVIPFGVAYGSNIEKVKKIVLNEIQSVANFVDEPQPLVRFLEMDNSSLNFKAYFYVDSYENRFTAIDEANTKIYNALNKHKIQIPFPQLEVHIKK